MKHIIPTLLLLVAIATTLNGQTKSSRNSLDPLIDLNDPAAMTLTKFKQTADGMTRKPSDLYSIEAGGAGLVLCRLIRPVSNNRYKPFDFLNRDLEVNGALFSYSGDKLVEILFDLAGTMKPKEFEKAKDAFSKATGDMNPKPWTYVSSKDRPGKPGFEWSHAKYKLQIFASNQQDAHGKETGLATYHGIITPVP